ncbi:MAG: DUF5009 domain-containing protein [Planctomycetes bacterium]|nr:DUF5009 domain-containing protein [Planctomycetota bacterium]
MSNGEPQSLPQGRIMSIDALRGFDMFWIIGGGLIFHSLHDVFDNSTTAWINTQLSHVKWEGFHFYDLIWPLFLFIVGVVLPFSISRRRQQGQGLLMLHLHVLKRAALLILLGLIYQGGLGFNFAEMRWSAVLTMIGISYFIASIIVLNTSIRTQAIITGLMLLGYWAALALIPAQITRDDIVVHFGAGDYSIQGNLISYLDLALIPGKHPYGGVTLGVGPFLTINGAANVLIGSLTGHWIRSKRPGKHIVLGMVAAGMVSLFAGFIWGQFFPVIKLIWTSSFVLIACGWSLLLLALFYWAIDVKGYKKWAFFFIVIGMNPITIYFLQSFVNFSGISSFFLKGVSEHVGIIGPLILPLGVLLAKWLSLWFLYRHKIFFKV